MVLWEFADFENCPGKNERIWDIICKKFGDVELVKDESEEQIVHLLPQEQINFGFMNGYLGILHKYLYDINVFDSYINLNFAKKLH